MAVYTQVAFETAALLMQRLGLGRLTELSGIKSGIENTNYYASTTQGQWVLTLFERLSAEELPYFLKLMQHLAEHGIPVPAPQADAQGQLVHSVAGRPASVVTRLPGGHRLAPNQNHCEQVGAMLGRMHRAVQTFKHHQAHTRGLAWWTKTAPEVLPHMRPAQAQLLRDELLQQQRWAASPGALALPQGAIHADLFRDNVMFDDTAGRDELCGFFDFYFAGTDWLLFDLAVCLNDWCTDPDTGALRLVQAQAFTSAYHAQRPLLLAEQVALPQMLRAAALRFWLSRLWDWHLPRSAALLQPKDPDHFERVLRSRQENPWSPAL
jgi:homoserine kinase type II